MARLAFAPGWHSSSRGVLEKMGLPADSLRLEITESAAMEDVESALATLRRLRDLGIKIAIDDFGTGYSSLSYLGRFPVDMLKIDRSFVGRLGADPESVAIVSTTVTLARNLGLEVVAEGVETAGQLAQLRKLGCDLAQGYHFAKPLPPEEIPPLQESVFRQAEGAWSLPSVGRRISGA